MFVNCPYCRCLVALDAQGLPLPRCPSCAHRLREVAEPAAQPTAHDGAASDPAQPSPATDAPNIASPALPPSDASAASVAVTSAHTLPTAATTTTEPSAQPNLDTESDADSGRESDADHRSAPLPVPVSATVIHPAERVNATQKTTQPASVTATQNRCTALVPLSAIPRAPHVASATTITLADASAPSALPAAKGASTESPDATASTPKPAQPRDRPQPLLSPEIKLRAEPEESQSAPRDTTATALPSFARATIPAPASAAAPRWQRRKLEIAAIATLLMLLALQLVLAQRAYLAADARWRPLISGLCAGLGCNLPPWREPQAFQLLERDIRERAPGVLQVSARIRNEAHWSQPWPELQLTLSDTHGRSVATRVFTPREYLGGTPTQALLHSGQTAAFSMDIVEPGPEAIAFTFDFR